MLRSRIVLALLVIVIPLVPAVPNLVFATGSTTYYVDCLAGSDSTAGTSPSTAWRTLTRANKATLQPGESLLLKRDCSLSGPLLAQWTGTAAAPILISAYGTGALPLIQNNPTDVVITGRYQIIDSIETRAHVTTIDPNCRNQPVGWTTGFEFRDTAAYNTLQNSKASQQTAGVNTSMNSHNNKVLHNTLVNNNVMKILTPGTTGPVDDVGAWGMILKGQYQEVAYNTFSNNIGCSYDEGSRGRSVELFQSQHSTIHHNVTVGDPVFSEVGGDATVKSDDNTFAYNQHVTTEANARFLIVRGGGSPYGPTWRTTVYNNTIYFTGPGAQGVTCDAGCSSDILTLENNILWATAKALFADAPFVESNNLYWNSTGNPIVQLMGFAMSPTSRIADPQFVNASGQSFRLLTTSPGIGAGTVASVTAGWISDLAGTAVPQGNGVDIGGYEGGNAPVPTPTPIPTIPISYYVDCAAGNDLNAGTSPTAPWKTLSQANNAPLQPGDSLLLMRGCSWIGPLLAAWQGTAAKPITIDAYGTGALPLLHDGPTENVTVTGTYLILQNLQVQSAPPNVDPGCGNQPYGYTVGIDFQNGAAYNTLQYVQTSGQTAGIVLSTGAQHNHILHNTITDNKVLKVLSSDPMTTETGAWGILVNGSDNEIGYNTFARNHALCSYHSGLLGSALTLYQAQRNTIHHNTSQEDQLFAILGGSTAVKSDHNTFAYNLQNSTQPAAQFLVTHGAKTGAGPTSYTTAYNNTVYLTGASSQGVVCDAGCSSSILMLQNNILWATKKVAFADAPFVESNNLYWNSGSNPVVQFMGFSVSPTSRLANPQFVGGGTQDFRLAATSPGIDAGTLASVTAGWTSDLAGTAVPQGAGVDIGAFEYIP